MLRCKIIFLNIDINYNSFNHILHVIIYLFVYLVYRFNEIRLHISIFFFVTFLHSNRKYILNSVT